MMSIGLFPMLLLAVAVIMLFTSAIAMPTDCISNSTPTVLDIFLNGSSCWLGYEFDSSLGYPGEGPPVFEKPPVELESEAMALWVLELEKVQLAIAALPFVQKVEIFSDDYDQNLNKIQATLWCCWDSSGSRFKRVIESCDKTGKKPTHLEAALALHTSLVKKHGCNGHVFDPRAVARREQLTRERSEQRSEAEAATTFDRIRLAQARQHAATRQASAAEQAAEKAREAEIAARLAREQAELQVKVLRAAADALKPQEPSHKKQRTAFSAGSSSQQQAQQMDVCEPVLDDDEAPTYSTWTPAKWKELEKKEQQRRKIKIDPARACATRTHARMHEPSTSRMHELRHAPRTRPRTLSPCTRTQMHKHACAVRICTSLIWKCTLLFWKVHLSHHPLIDCIGCLLVEQHGGQPAGW